VGKQVPKCRGVALVGEGGGTAGAGRELKDPAAFFLRGGGRFESREVSVIRTNTRTNEQIRAEEVRLIDENGKQLGIVPVGDALERARGKGFDLVEVAPDGDPPVCRIMDFAKFVYEQKRKQKAAKKKVHRTDIKEIKLRPNIDPHDLGIKLKHAREFLEKGHRLKLTVRYRMREMRHYEIGSKRLDEMIQELGDLAAVESSNRGNKGMRVQTVLLAPRKGKIKETEKKPVEANQA
jgi:translation initiation factor IF-3